MEHKQSSLDFRFKSFIYGFAFGVAVIAVAWYIV